MVTVLSPAAPAQFIHKSLPCQSVQDNDVVDIDTSQASARGGSCRPFRDSLRNLLRSMRPWRKKRPDEKQEPDYTTTSSRHSLSLFEQSIALMRTSSIRSLGKSFRKHSRVDMLDETWEDWLEQYQNGTRNLSTLSRPVSFCGFGHMSAPHHKNEIARIRSVNRVSDYRLWRREREWLDTQLRQLLIQYRLKSATVSLVEKTCQVILHEIGLGKRVPIISRELSIDAHTILSSEYFTLLDAGSDWRTRLNPLVHGPPFIKFYLGVPITISNQPVGCLAVFDPYLKGQVPKELIERLTCLSQELSLRVESFINENAYPKRKSRIQWADNEEYDGLSVLTGESMESEDSSSSEPSTSSSLAHSTGYDTFVGDTRLCPLMGPQPNRTILQPYEVFESLLRCRTIPQAIKKACRIVWQNLGSELVYIVETRMRRKVIIPTVSLRRLSSGVALRDIEGFREAAESEREAQTRFVGCYGPDLNFNAEAEVAACKEMHGTAIMSKYGFKFFASEDSTSMLRSGILMPFRRQQERVLWNEQIVACESNTASCDAYSGGFVMGAFVCHAREFSPGDVAFMKKVVKAVENILACCDEQMN